MLDIRLIREKSDFVRKNLQKRQEPKYVDFLDQVLQLDSGYLSALKEMEALKAKRNIVSRQIAELKLKGQDASSVMLEAKQLPERIKMLEKQSNEAFVQVQTLLMKIPNLLDDSVPYGKGSEDNQVVRKIGKIIPKTLRVHERGIPGQTDSEWVEYKHNDAVMHHGDVAKVLNGAEFDSAVKIAGAGFFAIKNGVFLLDYALNTYALNYLYKKKYHLIQPPFMMKKEFYEGVTDLNDFQDVMYKIQDQDLYLIATSEHPLVGMQNSKIFEEKELPLKLAGYSPCFRKEVGKHGLDERGFFRVHQFNKTEQVVFCLPEDSPTLLNEILKNSEELVKSLKIPYRVVNICTGDIGIVAAKKYDIECWSPREQKYFETHSISNCTSYQSVRSNIKVRHADQSKEYIHTLNGTAFSTTRFLRTILENCQKVDHSIKIPKALQKYAFGLKEITPPKPASKAQKKPIKRKK